LKPAAHRSSPAATACFPFATAFLPLATTFTEQAARGFALGEREAGQLVLAVEEVFSFYLTCLTAPCTLQLTLTDDLYQVRATLRFPLVNPDLRALNLTHRIDFDDVQSLSSLGLLIAARSVSGLSLAFGAQDEVCMVLTRERSYAPVTPLLPPPMPSPSASRLTPPTRDDLHHFAALLASQTDATVATFLPMFLQCPGMAADMLAGGALGALLAQCDQGMLGGVLWRRLSDATFEVFGPYLFYPSGADDLQTQLLDAAVSQLARTGARALLRRQGPLVSYAQFFDLLGELNLRIPGPEGERSVVWTHYHRQLGEPACGVVYAEPRLAAFLRERYEHLSLPRQVRETVTQNEGRSGASLLSVAFEQRRSLATLRPQVAGCDMTENLASHLSLLAHEGIRNVMFEIDTGRRDDTAFAPALYTHGFLPRLVIPEAGVGDLIVFAR